jgi:hypothetical protein
MIVKEDINERLIKHSSDNGFYIRQVETGIEYAEAIDVIPCRYTYEETDRPIEEIEETQNIINERED